MNTISQLKKKLIELYQNKDEIETEYNNINISKMVIINDIKRVSLLKENKTKEASKVAEENYKIPKRKNVKGKKKL